MPSSAKALWKVIGFVLMFLSLVFSSSSSHSLGVFGALPHLPLPNASCVGSEPARGGNPSDGHGRPGVGDPLLS
eukprot:6213875-Pleurochrysis_carterae.AAC.3